MENHSNRPEKPAGQNTCQAKNTARLRITPTTAAVIPVRGAVNCRFPCVDSTSGPPRRMKRKDGRNVKKVATSAPKQPARAERRDPDREENREDEGKVSPAEQRMRRSGRVVVDQSRAVSFLRGAMVP